MSQKTKRYKGKEFVKLLGYHGFMLFRIKGSHHILKHTDGRMTVVPVHAGEEAGEEVGIGLFAKILSDCELTPDALEK